MSFGVENWDVERYRILHTEEKRLQPGAKRSQETPTDISYIKEQRTWSAYTLVAEITCSLCASQQKIEVLLRQSEDGLDALVAKLNELLYGEIIPPLFGALYKVTNYDKQEHMEVELVHNPAGDINEENSVTSPIYLSPVSEGFPSAAEDCSNAQINLHELIARNPASTIS